MLQYVLNWLRAEGFIAPSSTDPLLVIGRRGEVVRAVILPPDAGTARDRFLAALGVAATSFTSGPRPRECFLALPNSHSFHDEVEARSEAVRKALPWVAIRFFAPVEPETRVRQPVRATVMEQPPPVAEVGMWPADFLEGEPVVNDQRARLLGELLKCPTPGGIKAQSVKEYGAMAVQMGLEPSPPAPPLWASPLVQARSKLERAMPDEKIAQAASALGLLIDRLASFSKKSERRALRQRLSTRLPPGRVGVLVMELWPDLCAAAVAFGVHNRANPASTHRMKGGRTNASSSGSAVKRPASPGRARMDLLPSTAIFQRSPTGEGKKRLTVGSVPGARPTVHFSGDYEALETPKLGSIYSILDRRRPRR